RRRPDRPASPPWCSRRRSWSTSRRRESVRPRRLPRRPGLGRRASRLRPAPPRRTRQRPAQARTNPAVPNRPGRQVRAPRAGVETVVHVREPRPKKQAAAPDDDVKGVKGSTRLEAKRQRRREGRDSGRRRPPIITEAEFLARRESVERVMVVRQSEDRTQIGV